jgi:hypothetical protein
VEEGSGRAYKDAAHRAFFVKVSTCRTRACCARSPRRPGSTPTP